MGVLLQVLIGTCLFIPKVPWAVSGPSDPDAARFSGEIDRWDAPCCIVACCIMNASDIHVSSDREAQSVEHGRDRSVEKVGALEGVAD